MLSSEPPPKQGIKHMFLHFVGLGPELIVTFSDKEVTSASWFKTTF